MKEKRIWIEFVTHVWLCDGSGFHRSSEMVVLITTESRLIVSEVR